MKLRPYQASAMHAINEAMKQGVRKQLVVLPTGCHAAGQGILMYSGLNKKVEDVEVGDQLCGMFGPKIVLSLVRGTGKMNRIVPVKGESFVVNEDHILTLIATDTDRIVDISVADYKLANKDFKHRHKLLRSSVDQFDGEVTNLPVDPYFLGVLIGDGSLGHGIIVCKPDEEIRDECYAQASAWGCGVTTTDSNGTRAVSYQITRAKGSVQANPIASALEELGLMGKLSGDKFVPAMYKTSSVENRQQILAGLLDTDGHLTYSCYDFISKARQLSEDVCFIARSLGLAAYMTASEKYSQDGTGGIYWRVSISGNTNMIPCRIPRKQANPRLQKKNVLRTGFKVIPEGEDKYYGFKLDGDGRFLLSDFTVTHNCGKTILFASLPKHFVHQNRNNRILVLAHREELVQQNADKIEMVNPSISVGIEMASRTSSAGDQIVVASPQSLGPERIQKFDPHGFDIVVADEAHHYTAPTFLKVLQYFGLENDKSKTMFIGTTATPNRGDGAALAKIFDRVVYQYGIRDAISDGYLSEPRGFKVYGEADLSKVRTTAGDFNQGQLADSVNTDHRNALIVRAWIDSAQLRQTVAFCVDIQHAKNLALKFQQAGVPAEAIWGADPERKEKLARHRDGATQVLTNCNILTEGYDDFRIACIIQARPTKSALLYTQMIGRGTRIQPGIDNLNDARAHGIRLEKEDCMVLDIVDSHSKHSLITLPSLFGMNAEMDLKGKSAFKAIKKLEELEEKHQKVDFSKLVDISQIKAHVEAVNLFDFKVPDVILQNSELRWHQNFDGSFTLRLPAFDPADDMDIMIEGTDKPAYYAARRGPQMLTIRENLLGQFEIKGEVQNDVIAESGIKSFADAVLQAELLLSSKGRKYVSLLRREWKSGGQPVTENQWPMLQRLYKYKPTELAALQVMKDKGTLTKQKASEIIDHFIQNRFQKKEINAR